MSIETSLMGIGAAWLWIIAGAVMLALEVLLPGVFLLWLGVAACVVGGVLLTGFDLDTFSQLVAFGILSIGLAVFARMVLRYGVSVSDQSQLNVRGQHYVGQIVVVEEPIASGRGKVRVEDTIWIAEGPDAAAGTRVKVVGVSGTRLKVEAA